MADVPVEVKKGVPAESPGGADGWRSLRSEVDRLFDLDARDVDVTISGDMLVLKGEKHQEKEEKDKNYHFSERRYGAFQRSFELPASVERDKIVADFAKGVLTITLPKTAAAQKQAKKIEVKSA